MALVAAKCTECGANIKIDNNKEAGICEFCGTAFITEKAINNYTTYITNNNNFEGANINIINGNFDNYLSLAQSAIDAGNGLEALDYSNKALEINATSPYAWIKKMKATGLLWTTVEDSKLNEIVAYGENAIKYSTDENNAEILELVYNYYAQKCTQLILWAFTQTKETTQIEQALQIAGANTSAISIVQNTDNATREIITTMVANVINLKLKIPDDYIYNNDNMQEVISAIAKIYIEYCKADVERIKLYGFSLLPEALDARETNLNLIKQGLREEKQNSINDEEVKTNNSNGCYIATCVYGSYNCPQVYTLRRFRDSILFKTYFGRLFIKFYYSVSPVLIKRFGKFHVFKIIWKYPLDGLVTHLNKRGIDKSFYIDKY
uniref:DNA REPAIR HELICASE RAD25, SSL2, PRE-INITIATION COMPLEX, RNA polymerase.0A n=1 Tax=Siphoviridae sp. ctZd434 TaxID=2825559 RepID=A0A8S5UHG8_9CAUD|nr:MAG TPA: DNA REPAIR HELICASE RAD25, SSL2, PRE-INITIATION COMPLEX, RNA polymerase.0A [Siphoviridae sp. ctZd434]